MADARRSSTKPKAGDEVKPPVKVLLVLGEYDNVLDSRGEYAQSQVHRKYDTVNVVDPDGDMSPRNIKRGDRPVVFDVLDMRQARVTTTVGWKVQLSAEVAENTATRVAYQAACEEAVQAIAIALSLARRDRPELTWQVEYVERLGEVGKL